MRAPLTISEAARSIQRGGVGIFPTETVYGIGANAFDERAVARLFEIKRRPKFNPLVVHICRHEQLSQICKEIPTWVEPLIKHFWPGPLTVVLPKGNAVSDLVTAGLPNVAVRMPDHPVALELLRLSQVPIAAPSANTYMSLSPTSVGALQDEIRDSVDFVLDGGPCTVGLESTIVGWLDGSPALLRPGGAALEQIECHTGALKRLPPQHSLLLAPGMAQRHYAPNTPLELWANAPPVPRGPRSALLSISTRPPLPGFAWQRALSQSGDLNEAATHLFRLLRELDRERPDRIYAELAPEQGLGMAINDRLRRGAHSG